MNNSTRPSSGCELRSEGNEIEKRRPPLLWARVTRTALQAIASDSPDAIKIFDGMRGV